MGNFEDIFGDMMKAYRHSSNYKDQGRMEIAMRKAEFESTLDKMWKIYGQGNIHQLEEYKKQVESIKETGCKVLRNNSGKHKIVIGG